MRDRHRPPARGKVAALPPKQHRQAQPLGQGCQTNFPIRVDGFQGQASLSG